MRVKLVFFESGLETFFGVKPINSDLYFCSSTDKNNKTKHLMNLLMKGIGSWISTENGLGGIIILERWLDVKGETEKWLVEKMVEFDFLMNYNNCGNDGVSP
jgi:hypothetical protein